MDQANITTAFELPNKKVIKNLGMARGVTVRSRNLFGTIGGTLQTLLGGDITLFTKLCEKTREEAYNLMVKHAEEMGANAIIAVRYDANDVMGGVTEVLCYGTAVIVE